MNGKLFAKIRNEFNGLNTPLEIGTKIQRLLYEGMDKETEYKGQFDIIRPKHMAFFAIVTKGEIFSIETVFNIFSAASVNITSIDSTIYTIQMAELGEVIPDMSDKMHVMLDFIETLLDNASKSYLGHKTLREDLLTCANDLTWKLLAYRRTSPKVINIDWVKWGNVAKKNEELAPQVIRTFDSVWRNLTIGEIIAICTSLEEIELCSFDVFTKDLAQLKLNEIKRTTLGK